MLNIKNYLCSQYKRRMKSSSRLTRNSNVFINLILLCIQPDQNTLIPAKNEKVEIYLWDNKRQGVKKDWNNLADKDLDNENKTNRLPKHISLYELFVKESILFLWEVWYYKKEFSTGKSMSHLKWPRISK